MPASVESEKEGGKERLCLVERRGGKVRINDYSVQVSNFTLLIFFEMFFRIYLKEF